MPDLIVQGPEPHQRWRRKLQEGQKTYVLGREAGWSVPWDDWISRRNKLNRVARRPADGDSAGRYA